MVVYENGSVVREVWPTYFALHRLHLAWLREFSQNQVSLSALTQCLGMVLEGTWVLPCFLHQLNGPLAAFHEVCCYCAPGTVAWLWTSSLATLGLLTACTFFAETKSSFPNLYCCATLLTFNSFTEGVTVRLPDSRVSNPSSVCGVLNGESCDGNIVLPNFLYWVRRIPLCSSICCVFVG